MLRNKSEPAVRVPPDAILLPVSKSMQNGLLLAEGISFRLFSVVSKDWREWNPACFRGGSQDCFFAAKRETTPKVQTNTAEEDLKGLVINGGSVGILHPVIWELAAGNPCQRIVSVWL